MTLFHLRRGFLKQLFTKKEAKDKNTNRTINFQANAFASIENQLRSIDAYLICTDKICFTYFSVFAWFGLDVECVYFLPFCS